jgi:hypothetical protein
MTVLGTMRAPQRLATFLLDMSKRYDGSDSCARLLLRMTRHDIGSYLGLKLETVSRLLSYAMTFDIRVPTPIASGDSPMKINGPCDGARSVCHPQRHTLGTIWSQWTQTKRARLAASP